MSWLSTVEFFKKFNSMCKTQVCAQCELRKHSHEIMNATGIAYDCKNFLFDHPEIAVPLVEQYSTQGTDIAFLQDAKVKHPNMPLTPSGIPYSCAQILGYLKMCPADTKDCVACWNQSITLMYKEADNDA